MYKTFFVQLNFWCILGIHECHIGANVPKVTQSRYFGIFALFGHLWAIYTNMAHKTAHILNMYIWNQLPW